MRSKLILFFLLFLVSCGDSQSISSPQIKKSTELCNDNGGLSAIVIEGTYYTAVCNNRAKKLFSKERGE